MFDKFPKKRTELPQVYKDLYTAQYKSNRNGESSAASLSQRVEAWMHRKVAADLKNDDKDAVSTLEIGAGTLNQLNHEQTQPYDIVEPFTKLFEDSPHLHKVRNIYSSVHDIGDNVKYDRITTIATFEHVLDLPEVVEKTTRLLNKGGTLRVSIPNEGCWLWTLGWRLTTGLEFKLKHGLDYGILMSHEHVNDADEIDAVLRHYYPEVQASYFGLGKHCSLYRFYECSMSKRESDL
jgi:hypothetical protein